MYSPEQTTRIINVPLLNGAVDTVVCTNIVVSDVPDPVHAPRLHGVEDGGLPVRYGLFLNIKFLPVVGGYRCPHVVPSIVRGRSAN